MDKTDFTELVRNINANKILLPDFQRDFVWKSEEAQKSIVASVLAKMPIGSILLLESSSNDYACIKIGTNIGVDSTQIKGKISFLLDGQQRLTVLTNVFSNVIQNNVSKVTELASASLKRRFFLEIPHWQTLWNNRADSTQDLFGVTHLVFPMVNPDSENPAFLSGEIKDYIEVIPFNASDNKPYNPRTLLGTELDNFCIGYPDTYLIPLFLCIATGSTTRVSTMQLRYTEIIDGIAATIVKEIEAYVAGMSENEQVAFMESFLDEPDEIEYIRQTLFATEEFNKILVNRSKVWALRIKEYIDSCLKHMVLNEVVVEEQDRKRAIDIYENMNKGGVSLSTFDLIMAKVAVVNNERYIARIINYIKSNYPNKYLLNVVPSEIETLLDNAIKNDNYNATIFTGCISDNETALVSKYIDVFLDVISLTCHNENYDTNSYNVSMIKKDKILSIAAEDLNRNTEKTVKAIDRALFFLQTRCGVRSINDINYSLMLVLIATIFTNDAWYASSRVHRLLEAWYWASIFSGEFDKDQNARFNKNLQNMIRTINGTFDTTWINSMKDQVLNTNNFSDKRLILMERVATEERAPKTLLRYYLCQFLLSRPYSDMFDPSEKVSVFYKKDALEMHHIVPLGSCTTIGESTKALRKDYYNICNSPVNFVLITSRSNNAISATPLDVYVKKIDNTAKTSLHLFNYDQSSDIKSVLSSRFDFIQGDIKNRITSLI